MRNDLSLVKHTRRQPMLDHSKFYEFLNEQHEEELVSLYRRTIDYVAILQDCLENDWDTGEEERTKWFNKIELIYSQVYTIKSVLRQIAPDRLDYLDGGSFSGTNLLNTSQNECVAVDAEVWDHHKKEYKIENSGRRSRNNEQLSGTDSNPDIPFCHYKGPIYKTRWYARKNNNKKLIFRRNIRVLVDKAGEPLGVKVGWKPEQVYHSFTKTLKETIKVPDYNSEDCSMKEIEIPLKLTVKIPVDVPEIFAILKEMSTGMIVANIMQHDPNHEGCYIQRIEGKPYCLNKVITAVDQESMLTILKGGPHPGQIGPHRPITATWKAPDLWPHKTVERIAKKKITYLKEGGLPFFGSKQLYFDNDGFQYEQQKGSRLKFTITNQHYSAVHNAFIQDLDNGRVSTCLARDKQGIKLQAYRVMRCPILRGNKTIMKNIVIYTDLKW